MAEIGNHAVVFITASSPAEGKTIADALVNEKLAACVNQVPGISSTYSWQGKVERATEVLLIAKTGWPLVNPLIARVKELHSYTVPEVIALPIAHGNPAYLRWIDETTA